MYFRKIIKITAEHSPNVRYARAQIRAGLEPTDEIVVPGVLPWSEFQKRLSTWDEVRQTIGLYAEFYEGAEVLLYPPEWLNRAEDLDKTLISNKKPRVARAMGVDPAEGGDDTAWAIVDEYGILDLISVQTADTSYITRRTIALIREWKLDPRRVVFDRGGGGAQIAHQLRSQKYPVGSVGFGETVKGKRKRGAKQLKELAHEEEERYAYFNRRAEMYFRVRSLLDPGITRQPQGFALPAKFTELRRQMSLIPLLYDIEGRVKIPPKRRRSENSEEPCLEEIMGCSPDETDALVLAVYALFAGPSKGPIRAG